MKKYKILSSVLSFTLLSTISLGYAAEVFWGSLTDDLYYNDEVLIDGVDIAKTDGNVGTSSVSLLGSGTLTVGNRATRGDLRITVLGGTEISSTRKLDAGETGWWEGIFQAPRMRSVPSSELVKFEEKARHPEGRPYPTQAFVMGQENETFKFSIPARIVLPVKEMNGTKLWVAYKKDSGDWIIKESDFCVVKNNVCVLDVSEINAVALVREFFNKCPRSKKVDTKIQNGFISGPPLCTVQCYKGYELNEDQTRCIEVQKTPTETDYSSGVSAGLSSGGVEKVYEVRPGTFRYQDARGGMDRYIDPTGLEGKDKTRIEKQNASLLKTLGQYKEMMAPDATNHSSAKAQENDFFNFYMRIFGNSGAKNDNIFPAKEANLQSPESSQAEAKGETTDTQNYGSAPLLPSTGGAGIFIGLTLVGVFLMILSYRRGNN